MRLEINKNGFIIVPENAQDEAFIEDSLLLKSNGDKMEVERVNDIKMGFKSNEFCLKVERKKDE